MIRKIVYFFAVFCGLVACSEDEAGFNVMLADSNIRGTKPVPGGAMLYYTLPSDKDAFFINVRYTDSFGQSVLKSGSYGSDSLFLDGFNEPQKGVQAQVTLANRQGKESAPIDIEFDTEASAAYAFFDQVEVQSYWDGFQVVYKAPERVAGMVHVYYEGINPMTQQPDDIFLESFPIIKGGDTLFFSLQQLKDKNTVTLRTQDAHGLSVGEKTWEDVESYVVQQLDYHAEEFDFIDVNNVVRSNDETIQAKVGIEYLFDGDIKGDQRIAGRVGYECYTFLAGPSALGAPFIIDMQEEKVPASLKIYGILNTNLDFPSRSYIPCHPQRPLGTVWLSRYVNKLPCDVTVYAGNSMDGPWTQLTHFSEDPSTTDRWALACDPNLAEEQYTSLEEVTAADSCCLELLFPATPQRYRYLRLVVNDTFYSVGSDGALLTEDQNEQGYVTMHELEVYVKKD